MFLSDVKIQIAEILEKRITQKTTSPYSSPVVFIKKTDAPYRFRVDLPELNRVTVRDAFPMPTADESFPELYESQVISLIGLQFGY